MKYYLALDLGGSKTSVALFSSEGSIVDDYVYVKPSKTYDGEAAVYKNTVEAINSVLDKFGICASDLLGIGVGCPGPLDADNGIILDVPLMKWKNFPLGERLKQDYGVPVMIENDGALGALAEQRRGRGVGVQNLIYVTISTGVGGGAILNGELYRGTTGNAMEFGHISIDMNGLECPCGNKGCLELYCSGTAIKEKLIQDSMKEIHSLVFEMAGSDATKLDARLLSQAADLGDEYALDVFHQFGERLGFALTYLFNLLDPELIVISGGLSKANRFYHNDLIRAVEARSINRIKEKQIGYSRLCDQAVLYGAYHLIFEAMKKE